MAFIFSQYLQEFRTLTKLAAPVALSQIALIGIGVTDVIVAGRAGVTDLAGVTLGSNVWTMIIYFFFGISIANQPLISELYGKKDWVALRKQFQQSIWMSVFTGLIGLLVVLLSSVLLGFLNSDPGIKDIAISYIQIMALAALAMTLLAVLRTTLESINQPRLVLAVNIAVFLLNIPLDIALVHGYWGLPELGGIGCAWASVIVLWLSVLFTYLFIVLNQKIKHARLTSEWTRPDFRAIAKVIKLGIPIGCSIIIELGFFNGAAVVIATLGAIEVSAHAVAISAASVAYMLYFGVGQAVTMLGAQRIGQGSVRTATFGIYFGVSTAVLLSTVLSTIFVLFRYQIAGLYSNDPQVIELAAQLIIWSALFQVADALQVTSVCGLRAFKDTLSPVRYQVIAFWVVAFPLGYLLATKNLWPRFSGPEGFWLAMTAGLAVAAILIFLKLYSAMRNHRLNALDTID